jgi:hypothetical protein
MKKIFLDQRIGTNENVREKDRREKKEGTIPRYLCASSAAASAVDDLTSILNPEKRAMPVKQDISMRIDQREIAK